MKQSESIKQSGSTTQTATTTQLKERITKLEKQHSELEQTLTELLKLHKNEHVQVMESYAQSMLDLAKKRDINVYFKQPKLRILTTPMGYEKTVLEEQQLAKLKKKKSKTK